MFPAVFHGNQHWQFYQPISEQESTQMTNQCAPLREVTFPQNLLTVSTPKLENISPPPQYSQSRRSLSPASMDNEVTSAVFSALHSNQNGFHGNDVRPSCAHGHTTPLSQLRLPTIKTTANIANNVMSEECDLGYSSFNDMTSLPDISDAINCSDDSDDLFQDLDSDFIEDVLGSIENPVEEEKSLPVPNVNSVLSQSQHTTCPTNIRYDQFQIDAYISPPFIPLYEQTYFLVPNSQPMNFTDNNSVPFCAQCNRSFQTKASFKVHMRTHRGDRPHSCPYCEKCFTQKSTLRTHIRTHTGEKPFVCNFCTRAFSDYSTFRKHVRVHTGEKPYVCDVCKKGFTQSGNMLRHREVHFKKATKQEP